MSQTPVPYKNQLVNIIKSALQNRMDEANAAIISAKDSRDSDTKSSAGDKYETGREMMQMEMNKAELQMQAAKKLLHELDKIDLTSSGNNVKPGSIVTTNREIFFMTIGFGKIEFDGKEVFVISPASPLGAILLNKATGTSFSFQGIDRLIVSVL